MQLGPIVGSKFAAHFGLEESYLSRLMLRVPYQKDAEVSVILDYSKICLFSSILISLVS